MLRSSLINGYEMTWTEQGNGPPVLFVHGSLTDYRYFENQVQVLGAKHRAISVSLRHYYPAGWDGQGDHFSLRQHVLDVAAFIQEMVKMPVHLVGHSRGGSIALYVARDYPDLVRSLVVAEGGGNMPALESVGFILDSGAQSTRTINQKAVALFEEGKIDEGLEVWMEAIVGRGTWNKMSERRKQMVRDNAWTLKGQMADYFPPFPREDLARIHAPTLLIGGEVSSENFHEMLKIIRSGIGHAERVFIPRSAHSMPAANPRAFNAAIADFVSRY